MRQRWPRAILVVLLILTPALVTASLRPNVAQAAPEQVYIALGDSIAAGYFSSLPRKRGYPWLVRDLMARSLQGDASGAGVRLLNLAAPGETTQSFLNGGQLDRLRTRLHDLREQGAEVRAVTLTLGGNDALRVRNGGATDREAALNTFRNTYPAVLEAVQQALAPAQPPIVVTTYYNLAAADAKRNGSDGWWFSEFNRVIRDTAEARGVKVADVEEAFGGRIQELTWHPIDIHPNNAGHLEIARLIWQALGSDQEAPRIQIERPAPGLLNRKTPTIRARVTDNIGVTDVELLVNGTLTKDLLYISKEETYVGVWDARRYPERQAVLTVRARDFHGHRATAEVTITLPGGS